MSKTFSDECAAMPNIKVGIVGTIYTNPTSGEAFISIINQSLIFGDKISSSLLTPIHMRPHGLTASDVPKKLTVDHPMQSLLLLMMEINK